MLGRGYKKTFMLTAIRDASFLIWHYFDIQLSLKALTADN